MTQPATPTTVAGGLRTRFIRDAMVRLVRDVLTARGWLDPDRRYEPIRIVAAPSNWDEPIKINSITVQMTDMDSDDVELGSNMTEDRWDFYIDFYSEKDSLGMDVIGDIRDALRGKLPTIMRNRPVLFVYDKTMATPDVIFTCDLVDVRVDRVRDFPKPWQKYWYTCRVTVVDTWTDEFGADRIDGGAPDEVLTEYIDGGVL